MGKDEQDVMRRVVEIAEKGDIPLAIHRYTVDRVKLLEARPMKVGLARVRLMEDSGSFDQFLQTLLQVHDVDIPRDKIRAADAVDLGLKEYRDSNDVMIQVGSS